MALPRQWKIIGATVVVAGIGLGGAVGAAQTDPQDDVPRIHLRDRQPVAKVEQPATTGDDHRDDGKAAADRSLGSPDGESLDSPFQSADDSPAGGDSLDTPAPAPAPAPPVPAPVPAPAPPAPPVMDSPDDSPAPAPAPAPVTSGDSVDSVSVDSVSVDSAD